MANYQNLEAYMKSLVYENDDNAISGQSMQDVLDLMIQVLGFGYQFGGIATPGGEPEETDAKVFYLATEPGTYTNYGSVELAAQRLGVITYAEEWAIYAIPMLSEVNTDDIVNAAVTAGKIATDAVETAKIKNGAVTTDKIADEAVTTGKIADEAMTTGKIADGAVTHAKVADNAVERGNIKDGEVITSKLADNAVNAAKIADNAVETAKIKNANVTTAKLADNAVETAKIKDANVTTAKLADGAVTTAKIGDEAVTTAKIGDAQVTTAKIADKAVTTDKLDDKAVTTGKIADGAITTEQLKDGRVELAERLVSRGVVPAEYTFRPSAGDGSINSGIAKIARLKGRTLAFNQLVDSETATVTIPSGHKYLSYITADGVRTKTIATSDGSAIGVTGGVDCVFDLTLMFGAGNEPSTVAEFEALFPLDYYAYNAGELLSVTATGIETVGFNQWDEEWVNGFWSEEGGGEFVATSDGFASKNYIPVFANTTYYLRVGGSYAFYVLYYDSNKTLLGYKYPAANDEFTTPANCKYITFYSYLSYGTTYRNDICINLSWSGYRNGEYEPYWSAVRQLPITTLTGKKDGVGESVVIFGDGLKSFGDTFDEITAEAAVKRIGLRAHAEGDESDPTVLTDGTNTIYVLDTPEHYVLDAPLTLTYKVDDFGTEKELPQNDDEPTTAPIRYDVEYDGNAVDTLRTLPYNYISKESMEAFLTELDDKLGAALNATMETSMTFDVDTQKYVFSISITPNTPGE